MEGSAHSAAEKPVSWGKLLGLTVVIALTFGAALYGGVQLGKVAARPAIQRGDDTAALTGIVETVLMLPINPEGLVHRGVRYRYRVHLENGDFVYVDDQRPRQLGSNVALVRLHGIDGYRLLAQ